MIDDIRKKEFIAETTPHLHALWLIALWLTKTPPEADDLMQRSINKAFKFWRPTFSKPECRVMLFGVLTRVFYGYLQRRPPMVDEIKLKRKIAPCVHYNRLDIIGKDPANIGKRVVVRLPVELEYIKILSKIGGFRPEEIAEIIGIRSTDDGESKFERGSIPLQTEPFAYSGQG